MDGSADKAHIVTHLAGAAERDRTDLKNKWYTLQIFLWSPSKPITKIQERVLPSNQAAPVVFPLLSLFPTHFFRLLSADTSNTLWQVTAVHQQDETV